MVGFFIKKAFFDGWDNLIGLIIQNVGFVALLALAYAAFISFQVHVLLGVIMLVLFMAVGSIYMGTVAWQTKDYAWYQRPGFRQFFEYARRSWKHALIHMLLMGFLLIMVFFVIPFYAAMQGWIGAVIVALLFWLALFILMGLMYYFPVTVQLQDAPLKVIRKCFLLVFDNIGFSLFLLIYTAINSILSVLTAFLIPGFAAVLMSHQIALKLLMYKYDYLEENPDADRKKIPWSALLFEERDKVGHRTLRGMIFPWKE